MHIYIYPLFATHKDLFGVKALLSRPAIFLIFSVFGVPGLVIISTIIIQPPSQYTI
jgi:hypothetical protein